MSKILVGIAGGIAAYKVAMVVSRLAQSEHDVHVVLTHGAENFVGRSTFAALCNRAPVTNVYDERFPLGAHIELAENADLLLVAPATARLLSSFAQGAADDLLATLYLAVECPVLVAPAMSSPMWDKPAVQRNVNQLHDDGVHFIGPESGWLSCRKLGSGRMAEPEPILEKVQELIVT